MAVPGRVEAASALLELDPPGWFVRHSAGVAEVAAFLAARAAARGSALDRRLAEAAALLHDVGKLLPAGHPERDLPHGRDSAAWLARRGYGELAAAAAGHPVTRLLKDDPGADPKAALEALIVAYADKRVGQRLIPLARRFDGWQRRYPNAWTEAQIRRVRAHAERLEERVCTAAGVGPADVRRLRWVGAALATARRQRAGRPS
jgi:HD superfamily phosphodiesterase